MECGLHFDNGVTSSFYNSFVTGHQQWAHVSGTEGCVFIPDFVLPFAGKEAKFSVFNPEFSVDDCDFAMAENREDVVIEEPGNSDVNSQETHLYRNFGNIVLSGVVVKHWADIALLTQRVMDGCIESANDGGRAVELS
jgi:hypothetical protein